MEQVTAQQLDDTPISGSGKREVDDAFDHALELATRE